MSLSAKEHSTRKPKRRTRERSAVAGLRWRGGIAYYERAHERLVEGRIVRSLSTRDEQLAIQYATALNTLCDRGDWTVLERWRRGELHVSDVARAVREGEYGKLRRLTADGTRLGRAVLRFIQRTEATLTPNTLKTYRAVLETGLLADLGADFPMADLSTERAESWLHTPKESAGNDVWSARSQGNARTICKALWSMVIEEEAEEAERAGAVPTVTRNPWKRARVPVKRQTRNAFLSPLQWRSLITHDEVAGTREAAFLGCATLAGLRQQEIVHLRTDADVDLASGILHVVDRGGEFGWQTKHEHSQRDVPIVPELLALLEQHIASGFAGERYFFRAYDRDRPISAETAKQWTMRCFKATGIRYGRKGDSLTLHSCRHTFASWLASAGVPFHVIAALLGNTAEVAMRTYSHLAPNDRALAMAVIQATARSGEIDVTIPNTPTD